MSRASRAPGGISSAALDELRARTPPAALIGRRVKLARSGKRWAGLCPFHNERSPSFYVFDDGYHCFGCGAHGDVIDFVMRTAGIDFPEAVRALSSEAGLCDFDANSGANQPNAAPRPRSRDELNENLADALALFRAAEPASGTIAEKYLTFRGCDLPAGGVLKFHPSCPRGRERLPAMLAAMTDPVTNRFVGVHRTFLHAEGQGKIEHGTTKMMLGGAGVVRLVADEHVTLGLGLAEGIETALAIMQHTGWSPVWAAGSAGGIAKFPVLAGIESLTIFPDRDDMGAGVQAAEASAARWRAAGREVRTIWPPHGTDWNDALASKAAA